MIILMRIFTGLSRAFLPHAKSMRWAAVISLPGVFLAPYVTLRVSFLSLFLILLSLSAVAVAFDEKSGLLGNTEKLEEMTDPALARLVRNAIAILYLIAFLFLLSLPLQSFLAK